MRNLLRSPFSKLLLFSTLVVAAIAYAQVKRPDGIHWGSKNTDIIIDGNLRSSSPDGGVSIGTSGVTLPTGQAGSCTLVSGTPSQCVANLNKTGAKCTCAPAGATAAIAAAGCSVTTDGGAGLIITGPNTVTTVVNYFCW
jgi:hypothetical protein